MDKKNKNDRRWILNLFLGKLHWSPKCSDQANNHGKVAAVKTDAVDSLILRQQWLKVKSQEVEVKNLKVKMN